MKKNKHLVWWKRVAIKLHLYKLPKYHRPTKLGRPTYYEKICPGCGEKFLTIKSNQKYHSTECRKKHNLLRKAHAPTDDELISVMRYDFNILREIDPVKAQRIAEEMEVLEGAEFKEIALDGLPSFKKPNIR